MVIVNTSRNRTQLVVAALAATFLTLTACGSGSQGGQSQASSPTSSSSAAASSTNAVKEQDNKLAQEIFDDIVRGDYTAATARFDSQMQQKLSAQTLADSWKSYQETFGAYQSHGDPQQVPLRDLTVVNIPLQMQQQPGQFRVTFHDNDGTVAGLYFLKTGVPVPGQ